MFGKATLSSSGISSSSDTFHILLCFSSRINYNGCSEPAIPGD
jgi:hypothetical protein